jgi:formamidopyrimidine-DNA glycosylase
MPELAEVEYYRKQWDPGLGRKVVSVAVHADKRVFRFTDAAKLASALNGARLLSSEASGKQMLFRFSKEYWLGIHLGMTGKLSTVPADFAPGKHDHLVLFQGKCALVFNDMRQFGVVRFDQGPKPPAWWAELPIGVTSIEFTRARMDRFLQRHGKLPIKAALLLQSGFPGVGNWMADEILWRARIDPRIRAAELPEKLSGALWQSLRFVCREAVRRIGNDFSDPPRNWLFHQRWSRTGRCPRDGEPLVRETIGGRTTAWCRKCQAPLKG